MFQGGFLTDAAQAIAHASPFFLNALVASGYLRREPSGRYELHELLRQYASEQLDRAPAERTQVLDRHCIFYAEFAAQRQEPLLSSASAHEEMRMEQRNLRAAWRWAIATGRSAELARSSLALLRGCGQLALCERPVCGLLVLAGIALIAPFCAAGALLGAGFGTLAARFTSFYARDEWAMGLAGFNPAIVGLLGGGFLASGELPVAHLLAPLALSLVLDVGCRRVTGRLRLPALSVAAFTTVYMVSLIAAPPGGWAL